MGENLLVLSENGVGLIDVFVELRLVVNELNETVEVALMHGEQHAGDLTVVEGQALEHGVEEVVADGGLGLSSGHGLEFFLGGQGEGAGGGGGSSGGGEGDDGAGLVRATEASGGGVGTRGAAAGVAGRGRAAAEELGRRVGHGGVEVLLHDLLRGDALRADAAGLVVAHDEGLGVAGDGVAGGVRDGLLRRVRGGEAHVAEAARRAVRVRGHSRGGDGAELGEVLFQNLVRDAVFERLDEQVRLHGLAARGAGERRRAFGLGLRATDEERRVFVELVLVHLCYGLDCVVVVSKVDESVATDGGGCGRGGGRGSGGV